MRGLSNSGTAGRAVSAADFDVGGARINRHRCSESAPAVTMKLSLELIRVVQMEAPRIPRWEPPPLLIGPGGVSIYCEQPRPERRKTFCDGELSNRGTARTPTRHTRAP